MSIFKVSISISINLIFNPYCIKGKNVVLQETDGTIISSPCFNLFEYINAAINKRFAEDPEFDIIAYLLPNFSAKLFSYFFTSSPIVKKLDLITF